MPTELLDFWQRCDFSTAPYAHPDDLPVLRKLQGRYINESPLNFCSFVNSSRFGDFQDNRLNLSLLPNPFSGSLHAADIIILLLNPGLTFQDYYGEYEMPGFRERLIGMTIRNSEPVDFPFMWLDPGLCWHGGFLWWERKLRDVLTVIAQKKFGGKYLDALKSMSRRLACIELVPYHAPSFKAHGLIDKLPSTMAARAFAARALESARSGEKTIIVTRQAAQWGITKTLPHVVVYEGGLTRGASMGVNTEGGQAILARYGIQLS